MRLYLIFVAFWCFVLFSCSVEKRLYRSGFYVQQKSTRTVHKTSLNETQKIQSEQETDNFTSTIDAQSRTLTASVSDHAEPEFLNTSIETIACDTIILVNGDRKAVKVIEIGPSGIRYKRCDGSGPDYVTDRNTIREIKYPDGTSEPVTNTDSTPQKIRENAVTHPLAPASLASGIVSILVYLLALVLAFAQAIPAGGSLILFGLGFLLGLAAVIMGFLGRKRIKKSPEKYCGTGLLTAGIILGSLPFLYFLRLLIYLIIPLLRFL